MYYGLNYTNVIYEKIKLEKFELNKYNSLNSKEKLKKIYESIKNEPIKLKNISIEFLVLINQKKYNLERKQGKINSDFKKINYLISKYNEYKEKLSNDYISYDDAVDIINDNIDDLIIYKLKKIMPISHQMYLLCNNYISFETNI